GNAVLDVVLAPGFLDHVRHCAVLFNQRLAELKDRYANLIAEIRGEGLLLGLRAVRSSAELVDEFRAEKLLTVAAGDNVVRLLPRWTWEGGEMAGGGGRLDRPWRGTPTPGAAAGKKERAE